MTNSIKMGLLLLAMILGSVFQTNATTLNTEPEVYTEVAIGSPLVNTNTNLIAQSYITQMVVDQESGLLQVTFREDVGSNIFYKIKDLNGNVYYSGSSHNAKGQSVTITYNTGKLPVGNYLMHVENEQFFSSIEVKRKRK